MEIIDYPNYLIYPDGKIYNQKFKRYLQSKCKDKDGYRVIKLRKDGKPKMFKLHRLIAIHYIPNPENKPLIDHKNRNTSDNRIENLRWATMSENCQNRIVNRNNKTTGIKNISYHNNRYIYNKMFNRVKCQKKFKTLEEAVNYKKEYELKYCKE